MGTFILFLLFSGVALFIFISCLADRLFSKKENKHPRNWLLKMIAITFLPLYLIQIALVIPSSVETVQIRSKTTDHFVTLEMKRGAYSALAFLPFYGALEGSGRTIYLHTKEDSHLVWTGDDFDHPWLTGHELDIQEAKAIVTGPDFTWQGTARECKKAERE